MSMKRKRLRFGPAGNSDSFYAAGFKQTVDTFAWQRSAFSLDAFEVSFGRGVSMGEETARAIGAAAAAQEVVVSAHAPYYINLANSDDMMAEKSVRYILDSAHLLHLMGGRRLVVHVGSPKGQDREKAMAVCQRRLKQVRIRLEDEGLACIRLCLETMGRASVIGSLDEIILLVSQEPSFLPCVDFAHLHAVGQGALDSPEAFEAVLDKLEAGLGMQWARQAHIHFSKIEFGAKGEVRHRIFADEGYGPEFYMLAPLLAERGYHGVVICESRGTMAEDAGQLLASYQEALDRLPLVCVSPGVANTASDVL